MSHLTRREGVRIEAFQEEVLAGEVVALQWLPGERDDAEDPCGAQAGLT